MTKRRRDAPWPLLTRVEQGEGKVITSPLVIFETVFTLQRRYKLPRERIKELVLPIISLRGLQLSRESVCYRAFALYVAQNISFADAYNAAYMEAEKVSEVYSFDAEFDKLAGIVRTEPEEER